MIIGKAYTHKPKYHDTKPEIILQNFLKEKKITFEKNVPLYGLPDIFISPNLCIFVDGEYWHNYPYLRNKDLNVNAILKNKGYNVLRFWAKDLIDNKEKVLLKINKEMAITI